MHLILLFKYLFYTFRSLTTLAEDFQNISESCLLVLHLEIRCHCFYYLMRTVQDVCSLMLVIESLNESRIFFLNISCKKLVIHHGKVCRLLA